MKRQLLAAEFFSTPWALMPERLNAFSEIITRWQDGGQASAEVMTSVQADAQAREVQAPPSTRFDHRGKRNEALGHVDLVRSARAVSTTRNAPASNKPALKTKALR